MSKRDHFFPPEALSKSITKLEIACGGAVAPASLTSAPCGSAGPVCFCFSQARSLTRLLPTHRQHLPPAVTYASSELPGTSHWPVSLDFKAPETRVFPSRLAQNRRHGGAWARQPQNRIRDVAAGPGQGLQEERGGKLSPHKLKLTFL